MKCETKYAPQKLDEIIFPSAAVESQIRAYADGYMSGSLIFWGPNGTGKSSIARMLANQIGGDNPSIETKMYEELVKLDDMRDYLMRVTHWATLTTSGKHFLLLEEFDAQTKKMETFWTALDACGDNLMVIITTNNLMGIHKSLRSRMTTIEMPLPTPQQVLTRAQEILKAEEVDLPNAQVLFYLQNMANPRELRKYMGVLDQLIALHKMGLPYPQWQPTQRKLTIVP
jgi:replication-associated recombination protein RarA